MNRLSRLAALLALLLAACGSGTPPSSPTASPSADPTPTPPSIPTSPPAPVGPTVSATVTRVADGQTIEVSIGGETALVRYIGTSITVTSDPSASGPSVVQQATAANVALVARQTVVLEQDVSQADAAGRLLRHVWVQNGGRLTLVSLALVSLGLARAESSPPDLRYDELLRAAEDEARDAGRGLWGSAHPGMSMPVASPEGYGDGPAASPAVASP